MLFTASLKRRNCCHYQTLKNVSSHRWIKADGTNSERVPNHSTNTQNLSMYSLPHNISGMYLCLCFNPCLDLLNLVTHVYLLLKEERHPQICFPWNSTSVFRFGRSFCAVRAWVALENVITPNSEQKFRSWPLIIEPTVEVNWITKKLRKRKLALQSYWKALGLEVEKEGRAVICKEKK